MISRGGQATNLATFANPTEAGGKFSQQGFTPGRYSVYVAADFGDTEFYSDPVFFDVVDKNVSGLEIKALRGLSVSGTLVAENSQLKDLLQQLRDWKFQRRPARRRPDEPVNVTLLGPRTGRAGWEFPD
jgi:hypothetical protein